MGIPCSHQICQIIRNDENLQMCNFHPRWRFVDLNQFKITPAPASPHQSKLDIVINQLRSAAQTEAQERALVQTLQDALNRVPLILHDPAVKLDGKGRPKLPLKRVRADSTIADRWETGDMSTKRLLSSWEKGTKKVLRRCGACGESGHDRRNCSKQSLLMVPSA